MITDPKMYISTMIIAVVLCLYALVYSALVITFATLEDFVSIEMAMVTGYLALATTPFLALYYLPALKRGGRGRMPLLMTCVMACPTLFWWGIALLFVLSATWEDYFNWGQMLMLNIFIGVPAFLSSWLMLAFAFEIRRSSSKH